MKYPALMESEALDKLKFKKTLFSSFSRNLLWKLFGECDHKDEKSHITVLITKYFSSNYNTDYSIIMCIYAG